MFIAAIFTIPKTWKQPKCPSTDEWIKMWYIYTMEYYSSFKKNKIMPFAASWMQLEMIVLSEVSQKEKDVPYGMKDIPSYQIPFMFRRINNKVLHYSTLCSISYEKP